MSQRGQFSSRWPRAIPRRHRPTECGHPAGSGRDWIDWRCARASKRFPADPGQKWERLGIACVCVCGLLSAVRRAKEDNFPLVFSSGTETKPTYTYTREKKTFPAEPFCALGCSGQLFQPSRRTENSKGQTFHKARRPKWLSLISSSRYHSLSLCPCCSKLVMVYGSMCVCMIYFT